MPNSVAPTTLAGESTRRSGLPMSANCAGSLSATLAGTGCAAAALSDDAARHRAAPRVHAPPGGGGADQHATGYGARFAQHSPLRSGTGRAPGDLPAQQRNAVERLIRRGMLDGDLIHADVELFGQHRADTGVDPLAHLDARHHQAHRPRGVDSDEGVRRERRIAVGRRRGGVAVLAPRRDEGVGLAGPEPEKGQRQAPGRECPPALEIDG
jgi:hypothetical protein